MIVPIQSDLYCVYAIYCPIEYVPVYVGCTKNIESRVKNHWNNCEHSNRGLNKFFLGLRRKKLEPIFMILEETNRVKLASSLERYFIEKYSKTYGLFNSNRRSGYKKSLKEKDARGTISLRIEHIKPLLMEKAKVKGMTLHGYVVDYLENYLKKNVK